MTTKRIHRIRVADSLPDLRKPSERAQDGDLAEALAHPRTRVTVLAAEAHHVGDTLLDAAALYGGTKAVDKIRKPPPPPPPPSSSASDGEA